MAIQLIPGTRFLLKSEWFIIEKALPDQKFLVESLRFGTIFIYSDQRLTQAFDQGELQLRPFFIHIVPRMMLIQPIMMPQSKILKRGTSNRIAYQPQYFTPI